jgi:glycosyltransferase involved in cell wall biosynthesis
VLAHLSNVDREQQFAGANESETRSLVLDVWSHIEPRFGGIGTAAAALATAVQQLSGLQTDQLAICDAGEKEYADGIPRAVPKVSLAGIRPMADIQVRRVLSAAIKNSSLCHVHGMWLPHTLAARQIAVELGKPVVSSVHGMLAHRELTNKSYKKRPYSWLFERPSLARSNCLRALTEKEASEYRLFGLRNPIAVVPTGVGRLARVDPAPLLSRFPELAGKRVVLFLSRVHYMKGVLNLVESWRSVAAKHSDAHLLVVGGDYAGTLAKAKELVSQSALEHSVTFAGVVSASEKLQALSLAKYFCLPSYSEGLSAAVLEALSIGLPVIITQACNVDGVARGGAGYVTSNTPAELAETLSEALAADSAAWERMSCAAISLARTKYDWSILGKTILSVYEWLLGGTKPSCIV